MRLLAVASENNGMIPPVDDLKHILNTRLDHLSSALKSLVSAGLINPLEGGYEPHNWGKHQYKSDTSADRVAKHRAKCNVTVTPPDTDTDTETDTEQKDTPIAPLEGAVGTGDLEAAKPKKKSKPKLPPTELELEFDQFWAAYPNRPNNPSHKARQSFDKARNEGVEFEAIMVGARAYRAYCIRRNDPNFVAQAVTWLNQKRWADDYSPVRSPTMMGRNFV